MTPRIAVVAAVAAFLVTLASVGARSVRARATSAEILPAVQFVGGDSKIQKPRFVLIKDEKAWATLWAEHTGAGASFTPPARHASPKIDFTRFMVVGTFAGATTNTDGKEAQSVIVGDEDVRVRFVASTFQTFSIDDKGDQGVKTVPFGLWVIEKTDRVIIIEEGTRDQKDAQLAWKEVKRFEKH